MKLFSYLWSVSWCVLMLNDALNSVYVFLKAGGRGEFDKHLESVCKSDSEQTSSILRTSSSSKMVRHLIFV
jgi:hypothetical protein